MSPPGITVRLIKDGITTPEWVQATPHLGQDYHTLLQECLSAGRLFEDPNFPAEPKSLGYNQLGPWSAEIREIQWKRPQEICSSPQFISDDMKWTDVCQGQLGNCWFLAAAASLTLYPCLLERVVPPNQSYGKGYAGIFHFQFWQYGQWFDVVVDDRLPVKNGELVFVSSMQKSEFWPALLEKAYAKLNGSYESLNGGWMNEAFVDFTGGLDESFDLKSPPPNLFQLIRKAVEKRSLMGASIKILNQTESEMRTPEGLVKGHAYSIIAAWEVEQHGRHIRLLRLRNPWGKVEWNGRWSDDCPMWSSLDPALRVKLQVKGEDGEFWMQMDDFLRSFDTLEVCNLTAASLKEDQDHAWKSNSFQGNWVSGHNAGGCRNFKGTFWSNPQYLVALEEADDDDAGGGCTLLVSLMQKDRRLGRAMGRDFLVVGFEIYQVPVEFDQMTLMTQRMTLIPSLIPVALSQFVAQRDVTGRYQLPSGRYLIIPSTYQPYQDGSYNLRMFSEKQHSLREMDCELRAEGIVFQSVARGSKEEFVVHFTRLSGEDQEISPEELQTILTQVTAKHKYWQSSGFSLEACRQLVKVFDRRGNGKLQLEEFGGLWSKIKEWEHIFKQYDQDWSGMMDVSELRLALEASGFHLSNQMLESLTRRHGDDLHRLDFGSFLSCQAHLISVFDHCRTLDQNKDGVVSIGEQEWLQVTSFK